MNVFEKVFGTHSERELKLIYPIVDKIDALRPEMQKLSDEELRDYMEQEEREAREAAEAQEEGE